MRIPSAEVPRRSLGLRAWLIGGAVLIVVLLLSLRGLARVYTDYLWFKEVGFSDTWRALVAARFVPALIFSAFFFVLMLVNLIVADRIAPKYRAMGPEDEIIEKYRTYVAPYAGRLRILVSLFFALVMGGGVSSEWRSWILFRNAVNFGTKDPQFHRDIGFYVFRLPFMRFAVGWLFAALLVVLIVTAVFHYINGGIRVQSPWQRVTPQVKVHLSLILAFMALTKTAQYYLARFELVFSRRGAIDGASYTDVKAQLPALNLLMLISIAAAILFVVNAIWRKGWVLPVIAVGLWAFVSIVVGTIYPYLVQRWQVKPNEFPREEPYIERNIKATREAFNIDSIQTKAYDYTEELDEDALNASKPTLDNVRLWDPTEMRSAVVALEERRPYYQFTDVDVDRYRIDGTTVPALVSARELDASHLPSSTWTNRHLVYTHGYAGVVADSTADSSSPSFRLADIPPTGAITLDQTDLYFGEDLSGYAVVDSKQNEQTPEGDSEVTTRYEGEGGVPVSSFVRKAAFALRFADWNLFVSGQLTDESRIVYNRSVLDRVKTAAPFLHFDGDPYPVMVDGKITWIVDAYTTTNRYPYSQSLHPTGLAPESGLDDDFNYVRNSVKATVDAYDGTVTFYVIDEKDPIIRAYEKAFPDLFTDVDRMPDSLREHWRYPEDMFKAQTEQFAVYHMTEAEEFYRKDDLWDIAPAATTAGGATGPSTTQGGSNGGRNSTLSGTANPIEPLYLQMQLPGEERPEFVLQRPYVPIRKDNQLQAFMFAQMDADDYGKLSVYVAPQSTNAPSPLRAATLIESTEAISRQFSLLDQRGSTVMRGDVQLLPLGNSIVYLRPIFVEGQGGGSTNYPRLRFVTATYGDRAVIVDTSTTDDPVDVAVRRLLGLRIDTGQTNNGNEGNGNEGTGNEGNGNEGEQPSGGTVEELLDRAQAEFDAADKALQDGEGLAAYQRHIDRAQDYLQQAQDSLNGSSETPPSSTTTTTAPTTGA